MVFRNKQEAMRSFAEKLRLTPSKINIHERIDQNRIDITEEFMGSAGGRVVKGRIDPRVNGESLGYYYYGDDSKVGNSYSSRTLAFEALKKKLPQLAYMLN